MQLRSLSMLALALVVVALAFAGCGSSSTSSGAPSGGAGAAATSTPTGSIHFAKTKFVLHVGLAFGAFHRYIWKPFRAGVFSRPLSHKLALAKAALATAFVIYYLGGSPSCFRGSGRAGSSCRWGSARPLGAAPGAGRMCPSSRCGAWCSGGFAG